MGKYTREDIIKAAQTAAAANGGALSRAEFERRTGIPDGNVYSLFPEGGWSEVQQLAGIARHPMHNVPLSDGDVLAEWHRVSCSLGRLPKSWPEFAATATMSKTTMQKRFGGRQGLLARYQAWLKEQGLHTDWRDELPQSSTPAERAPSRPQANSSANSWTKTQGPEYGAPINFRGLRHAPINEQGVVYLFGMVSGELEFSVEAVQQGFPDCEAKHCVDKRQQRWQRVHIEFEFKSSNFCDHRHNEARCDLIVCWEHDWPDCPLKVLELKGELQHLDPSGAARE